MCNDNVLPEAEPGFRGLLYTCGSSVELLWR